MSPIDHLRVWVELHGSTTEANTVPPHLHNVYNDLVNELQRMLEQALCPTHGEASTFCWVTFRAGPQPVLVQMHLCCASRLELFVRTVPPPPSWWVLELAANPEPGAAW